jgi:hypothetical protein
LESVAVAVAVAHIRFADWRWAQLEREAERSGASAAELAREAVTLRLAFAAAQAASDDPRGMLAAILLELRRPR